MYSRFLINQDRKLRSILTVLGLSLFISLCYPLVAQEFDRSFWPFLNGIVIGLTGGTFIILNELYIEPFRGIRQLGFLPVVFLTTLKYVLAFTVIIVFELGISYALENEENVIDYLGSDEFSSFILYGDFTGILFYALLGVFVIVFGRQLSKKLGSNVLFNLMTGKYHKPRQEQRVFMYIDITGSTLIAEKLAPSEYYRFVRDFVYDITGPIISTKGEIYRYIGDGVIITWPFHRGVQDSRCLRCIFLIDHEMETRREYYLNRYQLYPEYTIGMHFGEVIIGEIGFLNSQITFNGPVVYETDQLEKACKEFGVKNIVSLELTKEVKIPSVFSTRRIGEIQCDDGQVLECVTLEEKDVFYSPSPSVSQAHTHRSSHSSE